MLIQNFIYLLLSFLELLVKCFLFLFAHCLIFVDRVFYVGKIGVAILEPVYCVCTMRFCPFFCALFAYKWHTWASVPYHVIHRHFGTDWVIVYFAGLALQCPWFKLCLVIYHDFLPTPGGVVMSSLVAPIKYFFVWWSSASVKNHCCLLFIIYLFIIYYYLFCCLLYIFNIYYFIFIY